MFARPPPIKTNMDEFLRKMKSARQNIFTSLKSHHKVHHQIPQKQKVVLKIRHGNQSANTPKIPVQSIDCHHQNQYFISKRNKEKKKKQVNRQIIKQQIRKRNRIGNWDLSIQPMSPLKTLGSEEQAKKRKIKNQRRIRESVSVHKPRYRTMDAEKKPEQQSIHLIFNCQQKTKERKSKIIPNSCSPKKEPNKITNLPSIKKHNNTQRNSKPKYQQCVGLKLQLGTAMRKNFPQVTMAKQQPYRKCITNQNKATKNRCYIFDLKIDPWQQMSTTKDHYWWQFV